MYCACKCELSLTEVKEYRCRLTQAAAEFFMYFNLILRTGSQPSDYFLELYLVIFIMSYNEHHLSGSLVKCGNLLKRVPTHALKCFPVHLCSLVAKNQTRSFLLLPFFLCIE